MAFPSRVATLMAATAAAYVVAYAAASPLPAAASIAAHPASAVPTPASRAAPPPASGPDPSSFHWPSPGFSATLHFNGSASSSQAVGAFSDGQAHYAGTVHVDTLGRRMVIALPHWRFHKAQSTPARDDDYKAGDAGWPWSADDDAQLPTARAEITLWHIATSSSSSAAAANGIVYALNHTSGNCTRHAGVPWTDASLCVPAALETLAGNFAIIQVFDDDAPDDDMGPSHHHTTHCPGALKCDNATAAGTVTCSVMHAQRVALWAHVHSTVHASGALKGVPTAFSFDQGWSSSTTQVDDSVDVVLRDAVVGKQPPGPFDVPAACQR